MSDTVPEVGIGWPAPLILLVGAGPVIIRIHARKDSNPGYRGYVTSAWNDGRMPRGRAGRGSGKGL